MALESMRVSNGSHAYYSSESSDEDDIMGGCDSIGEAFTAAAEDISNKAAKVVADEEYKQLSGKHQAQRTRPPIHTPESWHALMHSGRLLSEATAVGSNARFNIGGKVKDGKDLNADDLEKLDLARKLCIVCKQTKVTAPAERKGGVHFSPSTITTSTIPVEGHRTSTSNGAMYVLPDLE